MAEPGIILKGIGGFYYVETACGVYECRARGVFRKEGITPVAGDHVVITVNDLAENTIDEIKPRRTMLLRPPVANIDRLMIVVASAEPRPNLLLLDRLTAHAVKNGIEPVIIFNKTDLCEVSSLVSIYEKTPFTVVVACGRTGEGIEEIRQLLKGRISAFTGNTGVGKSTLLNCVDPTLHLATGEISQKLGRGRHTTRECTLIRFAEDTYVADTPGFASHELLSSSVIMKEELADCFPEFAPFTGDCRFGQSCSHVRDSGCAVLQAVSDGVIAKSRHDSYSALYEEVRNVKEWQIK